MTAATARQTYRALVADVAARAKVKLPECNGRVEKATALVLAGDVFVNDDGTAEVGSCADPLTMHRVRGTSCSCDDSQYGRAPQGYCKHVLAVMLQTRVQQELAARQEPEVALPEEMEPWPDNDAEPEMPELAPASQPRPALPEAPASVNCHITVAGRQVQLTLRDTDEDRLLARLATVLQRFPVESPFPPAVSPAQPLSPPPAEEQRWCPKDGAKMQRNHKDGRSWFSHRLADGTWCKGT